MRNKLHLADGALHYKIVRKSVHLMLKTRLHRDILIEPKEDTSYLDTDLDL